MAQQYVDPIGGTLIIPAAYSSITVAPNNTGLSSTGVLVLVGEADSGPAFSEEVELGDNTFGPDELSAVVAKYASGNIVDAFRAAATAAVDPEIGASFNRAVIVKTNKGVKASSALIAQDGVTAYATLQAKLAGSLGNLINYTISNPSVSVAPTTGAFSYIPAPGATSFAFQANGEIAIPLAVSANTIPSAFVTAVDALAHVAATGGVQRTALAAGTPNLGITVAGNVATFTLTAATWDPSVAVGDVITIPTGSGFVGVPGNNEGWYVITSIPSVSVLVATKLADTSTTAGHVAGAVVAPIAVAAKAINVTHDTDIKIYAPVVITWASTAQAGVGASLEIATNSVLAGDTDPTKLFYQLGTANKVTWLSQSGSPALLTSATELSVSLNLARASDMLNESIVAGGEIAMKIGYWGYSCSVQITTTQMVVVYQATSVSSPVTLTLNLASYPTIADLVSYLNSNPGFVCSVGTAVLGNLNPALALDHGTFAAASVFGTSPARIKIDAYRLNAAMASSLLAGFAVAPVGGLPNAVAATTFLMNGAKGGTTAANVTAAIDAVEQIRCNFIVPLFSRDASADIADGLTDASSTYTVAAINSYVKSHVHKMSTMKAKRNRQAFLSYRGAFNSAAEAAANLASYRCSMVFQDVKSALSGSIVQYQPWCAAVLGAATQAGGFYKSLVRKQVNITGAVQAAGDWTYNLDSNLENALKAGLNPIRKAEEGGFVWVSDQTTYGRDASQVYNSIQMVYAADTVALTTAQRMERAFVGRSIADTTAAMAMSFLDGIMADFLRLKLIAPSSDAPLGYKNARIVIEGPAMRVSVEVKIAGSIYFVPISFYVTEITQTA